VFLNLYDLGCFVQLSIIYYLLFNNIFFLNSKHPATTKGTPLFGRERVNPGLGVLFERKYRRGNRAWSVSRMVIKSSSGLRPEKP